MMHCLHSCKRGFSLTELLTASAVVIILLALGVGGVRALTIQSATTQCLSNLKGLHTATMAYAAEHQGEVPVDRVNRSTGSTWYMALREGYLQHPGPGLLLSPYFCKANKRLPSTGGGYGWTNYAVNGNIYYGGTNLNNVPDNGTPAGDEAYLQARSGPRFQSMDADKALYMDSRDVQGGTWYAVDGARWGSGWPDCYPVHGDAMNVIFIGGHARTVKVFPRTLSPNRDLNELRADWFWPLN